MCSMNMLQPSWPPRQVNSNPASPSLGERPINRKTLSDAVRDTHGRPVIAEDHRPEGGLGSAVLETLAAVESTPLWLAHLAVRVMPRSGTPTELLAAAAIDAASIERAARRLLDGTNGPSHGYDAPASTPTPMRHWAAEQSCRVSKTIGSPASSPTGGETTRWGGDAVTPYEANRPVVIAGVAIRPGDYVFADASGAAVIPAGDVRAVLHVANQVVAEDAQSIITIRGETPNTLGDSEN